jgi:hypothetical protein
MMLDVMSNSITTHLPDPTIAHPDPTTIRRALERRSVATLATVSTSGRPHAATVLYQCVDDALFVSTDRDSRKARNVADTGVAAVTVFVRRLPVGPPSSVQFQTTGAVLATDDPEIIRLGRTGSIDRVTSHGELERAGGCFLRLDLPDRVITYGLGMSLWQLMRNPLDAAGTSQLRSGGHAVGNRR